MNFFKWFTSVFLCCVLLSFFFVVPVSASDDSDYYSFPPVGGSGPSLSLSYPVNPSATGDGWSSSDSVRLRDIWQALTDSSSGNSGSIAYCVWWIWNYMKDDIRPSLGNIDRNTSVTASRILDSNSLLGSINTAVSGINGFATENSLSTLVKFFTADDAGGPLQIPFYPNNSSTPVFKSSFKPTLGFLFTDFLYDSTTFWNGGDYTIFHYIKYSNKYLERLKNVLATDEDLAMREDQKDNVGQVKKDFLSGKSGKTSLGKEDFGSLSGVGGTFKDITSLNGQASIGSFTDGLSSANETGQGWFSQATKDALDSVSDSSSNVSTFSVDGDFMEDADVYNMAGFEDHYTWLWGD